MQNHDFIEAAACVAASRRMTMRDAADIVCFALSVSFVAALSLLPLI